MKFPVNEGMKIEVAYVKAYQDMDRIIARQAAEGNYVALGLTSNLDVLCDFQIDIINKLLVEYMPDADLNTMQSAKIIRDMEEFLETVVFYCKNGIGGEVDIADIRILENLFKTENAIGGTAVHGAMALAAVGFASIVHLTDDSKEVCDILQSPFIYTINTDGQLLHMQDVEQSWDQEVHLIIQFKKGDVIRLKNQEIIIPSSNRLIIPEIVVNKLVPLSKPFFKYIEDNAKHISSHVLSSFHGIEDTTVLAKRLTFLKQHIKRYKTHNKRGIIYCEDAHYHSSEVRKMCVESLYSAIDILSLNEEELLYNLQADHVDVVIDNIISCVNGVRYLKQRYGIQKGVIVHTKDYSMYVGDHLEVDIEGGLIYGNLLGTAKAMFGSYGTKEQIKEILTLPISSKGMENKEIIDALQSADQIVLVPTKYIDTPKYTVGLGDSFTAGVQMCFN